MSASDRILRELREHTWVMLRPSALAGVGVFAVRDIPKGCRAMFTPPSTDDDFVPVARADIDALPAHAKVLVENYCLYDADWYYVPRDGFTKMDLVHFLNHSETPNVLSIDDGNYFETTRDISAGEELLVDYGDLVNDTAAPLEPSSGE